MPPNCRGPAIPPGFQSKSTPNLPTLRSLEASHTIEPPKPTATVNREDVPQDEPNSSSSTDDASTASLSSHSDDDQDAPTRRPLYASRSHTSLFPPFYNRPPTPLPPSPSLTSLLRPSFSATTSRPGTASSSDAEITSPNASTPNLSTLTASARHAPTVPRASPKVPTYEYYGFAVYLASSAAFLMYILWAYVPSPMLHQMGIHYYPNRWWALAVPAWLVMLVIWIYVALASYNTGYLTLPMTSVENLVDRCGTVAVVDMMEKKAQAEKDNKTNNIKNTNHDNHQRQASDEKDWKSLWSTGTDAVLDVPIGGVCEILYGSGREDSDIDT